MAYEVVVVGGGFGGLTAAALMAARGLRVCLVEKNARAGGCAAGFEKFGHSFESGAGLYAGWGPGEIHERVFQELPVASPETYPLNPSYTVRLPDQTEIAITNNDAEFEESLRAGFPECSHAAINFYRELRPVHEALERTLARVPDILTASRLSRLRAAARESIIAPKILAAVTHTAAQHLEKTSARFRRFIDAQLQIFGLRESRDCAYLYAAVALSLARRGMHGINGGAAALAQSLVQSIRASGGLVRFDTTALRLAYDSSGRATGLDLLTGERIEATRAIVSNLTVWDTYGKLVSLNRTPAEIRQRLKALRGWGAYLLYLSLDEKTARKLPSHHILSLNEWQEEQPYDPQSAQFMFAAAPAFDRRAPSNRRAVTVSAFTDTADWFTFHEDESEHEALDQSTLEAHWERIHRAMPELADGIEVIETATPRTFYEETRRKLGMVGGVGQSLDIFGPQSFSHRTILPNLYMVGDTVFPGNGIAAVTHSALIVADEITRR